MTLHDKTLIQAALSSAAYLLGRADDETMRAWETMLDNAEYGETQAYNDALNAIRHATETITWIEARLREEQK